LTSTSSSTASLRARLQLSIGSIAELGEEMGGDSSQHRYSAAARDGGRPLIVTVHPPPPNGPDLGAMDLRLVRLRELGHRVLDLPVAWGDVDGRGWVADDLPSIPTAAERLARGPLALQEGVSVIRDVARALAAMHRREIAHGAISLEAIRIGDGGTRVGHVGNGLGVSPRHDLDALGEVAWLLLSGQRGPSRPRPLSQLRRGVSPELENLCAMLLAADPVRRPQCAEAVLDALDSIPSRRAGPPGFIDRAERDARRPMHVAWFIVGAAALLLLVLAALRG
jgi:hypothetical protein